jgi:acyl-CoA thioesterase I
MGKLGHKRKYLLVILILSYSFPLCGYAQKFSFISNPVNRIAAGANYKYTFAAFDSMGRTINFTCINLPSWIKYNKETNTLSGFAKKTGQYLIQIDATKADTIIKQHFMLTVYNKQTVNILPLGNSITNGTSIYNSYRRSLWQMLHKKNYNFDFIGSWDKHHMGGEVPNPDFDMDHDGHSGWTAHHILEPPDWDKQRGNIDLWLHLYKPDIVLIELGTNDVFQCVNAASSIKDLSMIIDKLRKKNALVKILLAQIPPLGEQWAPKKLCGTDTAYEQAIKIFNKEVVHFAGRKTNAQSPVIIVDQFTGINPATDMYDDIHPNAKGEMLMAERWYKGMKPFLTKLK